MVTTVSQLRVGHVIMSSKHHSTFYSSTRQFSSNNFFFLKKKFYENGPKFPKLRLVFSKDHSILRCELSNNCSKANIFPPPSLQKKSLKFINTCSIHNLFGDDFIFHGPLIPMLEKISTKFASLLLLGVLTMMITALVSRDSAIAASYGRMGGGRSNSYSSRSSRLYRSSIYHSSGSARYPFETHYTEEETYILNLFMVFMLIIISVWGFCMLDNASVLMLQVGISDENREFLRKLNRIAQTADISTPRGLINILNEVSEALRQHYDSCHFAYFFEKYNHTKELLVKPCYKKLVIRERARYAKETLTNVDGAKSKTTAVDKNSTDNEFTVVTVLVLLRGKFSFPSWRVERALQTFCSIPITNIQTVQVLWNPQTEGETLSEQQLCKDFPLMKRYKTVEEKRSLEY